MERTGKDLGSEEKQPILDATYSRCKRKIPSVFVYSSSILDYTSFLSIMYPKTGRSLAVIMEKSITACFILYLSTEIIKMTTDC